MIKLKTFKLITLYSYRVPPGVAMSTIKLSELFTHALSITAGFAWGSAINNIMHSFYPVGATATANESTFYAIVVTMIIIALVQTVNYVSNTLAPPPKLHMSPEDAKKDNTVKVTW